MRQGVITVKIGADVHTIDLSELQIQDADLERHQVAADVAWWGSISAAAEGLVERLTAMGAQWHAAALTECLKVEEKMSEWKAKASATAHPSHLAILNDIAKAREELNKAQAIHWSLIRKSDMLRSMIAAEVGDKRSSNDVGRMPVTPQTEDPRYSKFKDKRKTSKEDS